MADNSKLGVYICSGCDISKSIDCTKLTDKINEEFSPAFCKVSPILCSMESGDEIKKTISEANLERVVICACSHRYMTDVFRYDKEILTERVNLREQVAWTQKAHDDETELLALDYCRMGITKALNSQIPYPVIFDINDTILVVGGGVAGLNAALSSADAGYNVILTEKESVLGGYQKTMYKLNPTKPPYLEPEINTFGTLIAKVENHHKIKTLKSCEIKSISGQPGQFNVTALSHGQEFQFQAGSIIQATGWRPYNPDRLSHLGYGRFNDVVTNIEIEKMANNGGIKRKSDNGAIRDIVFLQCAGSRDEEHLPYCSSVCCMTSLKQAMYIREKYPDSRIYIIYKDMRTPAQYEKFYKRVQTEDNIFLTKGELSDVSQDENGRLLIDVNETLIGQSIRIEADMLVLATGIVPSTLVEETDAGSEQQMANGKKAAAGAESGARILNLTYRQGTDLPTLHYGFPDSHYICFPYETRRTGIYAAGTVRAPMDCKSSKDDALGAAMKAIQMIENVRKGTAVHPRAGDTTYPEFFLQRCTQCKRCTEECPFGTLDEDDKGTPKPNPGRCRRCGICMGACPERIISFKNYSVQIISSVIKSIEMPPSEDEKPRMLAFLCENDAYPSFDLAASKRISFPPNIRIIPVRCLGSVSTSWIADALSAGFDGVILIGCKHGEDYQCHFIRGSELANIRMENVQEKLKQLVLEPERVELHELSIDEYGKLPELFSSFTETIRRVGPNPYKDM